MTVRIARHQLDFSALGPTAGFNTTPEDHGAVGDGATDDTTAIIAAIDACAAAGGGDVLFAAKTYLCNGALRTDRHGNAVIPLPIGRTPIRLIGATPANQCDVTQDGGRYSIIKTTKTGLTRSSSYGVPSLIGGATDGTWSDNMVSIINLAFWLPANPTIAGVDLRYVRRMLWDGSTVTATNVGASDFTQPTSVYAFGLRTPEEQNYNAVLIRNGSVGGMYVGIVGTVESLTLHYWSSKWCKIGFGVWGGGHTAAIIKLSLEWCAYHISGWSETAGVSNIQGAISGYNKAQVAIAALALEDHSGGAWYDTVEHVHDPTNQLSGVVFFDRLDAAGAFASTLTVNGATSCKFVPLLSPSFGSSLAVQDENATVATGVTQIDFQGAEVTAAAGSGEVVVTIPGLVVQDENGNVSTAVTQLDFQGAGVTATAGSGEVVVTIPGGSSSSGELLMQDGVTGPPVPLENEARSDWLYQG